MKNEKRNKFLVLAKMDLVLSASDLLGEIVKKIDDKDDFKAFRSVNRDFRTSTQEHNKFPLTKNSSIRNKDNLYQKVVEIRDKHGVILSRKIYEIIFDTCPSRGNFYIIYFNAQNNVERPLQQQVGDDLIYDIDDDGDFEMELNKEDFLHLYPEIITRKDFLRNLPYLGGTTVLADMNHYDLASSDYSILRADFGKLRKNLEDQCIKRLNNKKLLESFIKALKKQQEAFIEALNTYLKK